MCVRVDDAWTSLCPALTKSRGQEILVRPEHINICVSLVKDYKYKIFSRNGVFINGISNKRSSLYNYPVTSELNGKVYWANSAKTIDIITNVARKEVDRLLNSLVIDKETAEDI